MGRLSLLAGGYSQRLSASDTLMPFHVSSFHVITGIGTAWWDWPMGATIGQPLFFQTALSG
jgi:hypothetical protein